MKEIKHYVCDFCKTEYNEKAKAQACEKGHHAAKQIKAQRYIALANDHTGYPQTIDVEMDDGKIVKYKR